MTENTTQDTQSTETPIVAAFRLVDGQVIVGQVWSISSGPCAYTVKNPAIYAVVQKEAILAGEAPRAVPAMQKYRTMPYIGAFPEELFLQSSQIIGFPEEITIPEIVALYSKTIGGSNR